MKRIFIYKAVYTRLNLTRKEEKISKKRRKRDLKRPPKHKDRHNGNQSELIQRKDMGNATASRTNFLQFGWLVL